MSGSFVTAEVIALPVVAETAAWLVPCDDELRVLINSPPEDSTLQLRMLSDRRIDQLPSLPMIAAGGHCWGQDFVVTGSDQDARPLVFGVAADGSVTWQLALDDGAPIRWPVPVSAPQPTIVWQIDSNKVEAAEVTAGALSRRRSFPVGGPPLSLAGSGDSIWAAWPEPSRIVVVEAVGMTTRTVQVEAHSPSEVAVEACSEGAWVGWAQRGKAFLTQIKSGEEPDRSPLELDLGSAAGGTLAVVSGPEPTIWAQRLSVIEGEAPQWTSVLSAPGGQPVVIGGHIHSIAWWDETLITLGVSEMRFLKRG